jgi:hypothetical protein
MRTTDTFDTRGEAIAGRLRRLLNEGMLALLAGLGSRAGWLDALAAVEPAPAAAVARAAGADEARVRPWLAALVAGRLVDFDGARQTYALAPELADFLRGDLGRAYRRGLAQLLDLAARAPRDGARARDGAAPPTSELIALVPGLAERLARGGEVLELRDDTNARPAAYALVLAVDGARARDAEAVAAALAPGGVALLAVPALSDSPADDALHPLGAFLLGARALAAGLAAEPAAALGARLARAGLSIDAVARVPSDPFRDYLIAHKPDSRNAEEIP